MLTSLFCSSLVLLAYPCTCSYVHKPRFKCFRCQTLDPQSHALMLCSLSMHLALLRGSAWEAKHWQKLLSLVGLPSKNRDSLTLKDLLGVSNAIAANADAIRELDAQAQSEGIIRKALEELDMWGFQRKFALTQSADSAGRQERNTSFCQLTAAVLFVLIWVQNGLLVLACT